MTIWALAIGVFVLVGGIGIGFQVVIAIEIAIGVTVASAPGVLNLVVTVMMTYLVKRLSFLKMIAKKLYVS